MATPIRGAQETGRVGSCTTAECLLARRPTPFHPRLLCLCQQKAAVAAGLASRARTAEALSFYIIRRVWSRGLASSNVTATVSSWPMTPLILHLLSSRVTIRLCSGSDVCRHRFQPLLLFLLTKRVIIIIKDRVRFAPLVGAFDWSRPAHPLFLLPVRSDLDCSQSRTENTPTS